MEVQVGQGRTEIIPLLLDLLPLSLCLSRRRCRTATCSGIGDGARILGWEDGFDELLDLQHTQVYVSQMTIEQHDSGHAFPQAILIFKKFGSLGVFF